MFEAVRDGASDDAIEGVEVVTRAALAATPSDVLAADAYLLGTTANIGYMSGALKHFFDTVYYQVMDETARRPYAAFVHGNSDTAGAVRAIETITTGLDWKRAREPVTVLGDPDRSDLDACYELGGMVAAGLVL